MHLVCCKVLVCLNERECTAPVSHVAGLIPLLFLSGLFSFIPRSWPAAITEPVNTSIMPTVVCTLWMLTGCRHTHQSCRANVSTTEGVGSLVSAQLSSTRQDNRSYHKYSWSCPSYLLTTTHGYHRYKAGLMLHNFPVSKECVITILSCTVAANWCGVLISWNFWEEDMRKGSVYKFSQVLLLLYSRYTAWRDKGIIKASASRTRVAVTTKHSSVC